MAISQFNKTVNRPFKFRYGIVGKEMWERIISPPFNSSVQMVVICSSVFKSEGEKSERKTWKEREGNEQSWERNWKRGEKKQKGKEDQEEVRRKGSGREKWTIREGTEGKTKKRREWRWTKKGEEQRKRGWRKELLRWHASLAAVCVCVCGTVFIDPLSPWSHYSPLDLPPFRSPFLIFLYRWQKDGSEGWDGGMEEWRDRPEMRMDVSGSAGVAADDGRRPAPGYLHVLCLLHVCGERVCPFNAGQKYIK